jgi:hypothetical protein
MKQILYFILRNLLLIKKSPRKALAYVTITSFLALALIPAFVARADDATSTQALTSTPTLATTTDATTTIPIVDIATSATTTATTTTEAVVPICYNNPVASSTASTTAATSVGSDNDTLHNTTASSTTQTPGAVDATDQSIDSIATALKSMQLPIGKITLHPVQNSKGTAIYLPQVHRNPGSSISDPINNSAEIAQRQIYDIISYLVKNKNIKFAMAEGDIYGKVPQEKIDLLKNKIGSGGNSNTREINLAGAPYRLKAEGVDFTLYGGETKSTYDQSADIVRDYIYLSDRLDQLK